MLSRARVSSSASPHKNRRRGQVLRIERLEDRAVFAGDMDPTFGGGDGIVLAPIATGRDDSLVGAMQVDGTRIVVAGTIPGSSVVTGSGRNATTTIDQGDFALVRYNEDGSLDATFGVGGKASTGFGSATWDEARDFVIAPDGKYIVVGHSFQAHTVVSGKKTTTVNGWDVAVARFLPSGVLDTTFSGDGKATYRYDSTATWNKAFGVVVQADGKIVVGGDVKPAGTNDNHVALARFNADGSLDATFGLGGTVVKNIGASTDEIKDLALQTLGGTTWIVAAGRSLNGSTNTNASVLLRYSLAGQLDTSFGSSGSGIVLGTQDVIQSLAIQPDGKIVAAGQEGLDLALARFEANGILDTAFSGGGSRVVELAERQIATGVVLQPDGQIVVLAGWWRLDNSYRATVAVRFDSSGSLDATFGDGGLATVQQVSPSPSALALQGDGKILVAGTLKPAGSTPSVEWCVVRLTGDEGDTSAATDLALFALLHEGEDQDALALLVSQ